MLEPASAHVHANERFNATTDALQGAIPKRSTPTESNGDRASFTERARSAISDYTGLTALKEQARREMQIAPNSLPRTPNPLELGLHHSTRRPDIALMFLLKPGLRKDLEQIAPTRSLAAAKTAGTPAFAGLPIEKQQAQLLSQLGVGSGKVAQLMASDESLTPQVRKVFEELKSGGAATRTLAEAQSDVNRWYGTGTYKVSKIAGVGTIGEAYHARNITDGKPVVIKMLKSTVSPESLAAEERIAKQLLHLAYPDPQRYAFKVRQVENAYRQWAQELDFTAEAENAALLGRQARTYRVAQALDIGRDAHGRAESLVLEKADGLSLDSLMKRLQAYDANPEKFREVYRDDIARHPWLNDIDTWRASLPSAYREAMNEQTILTVNAREQSISHGDPHTGNVFVHVDSASGKPAITFIDKGLVVKRSSREMARHAGLMLAILTGNSSKLSSSLVELSEIEMTAAERSAKQAWIANELDRRLFKAHVDITDSRFNSSFMDHILDKMQIQLSDRDFCFAKSQFQTISTYKELSALSGQQGSSYLKDSLIDMGYGAGKLLWHEPMATTGHLLPAAWHFAANPQDATRNTLQYILRRPDPS